ncbi:tetratricopeptide repeat protein [Planctomycetales bacterium ZRK34]|nr:tetratricopeptide repeat protein [Planctomycetales bacterium ZRK34]
MKHNVIAWMLMLAASSIAVAQVTTGNSDGPLPMRPMGVTPLQLQIWNDPAFQKAFAESYTAETDIEPRVTAEEREKMFKVLELLGEEKLDEAVKLIQKNQNEAASAVFDFTLANIHFQNGQLDEAAANYQTAVEKFPKFRRAWKNLALIYVQQKEFAKAIPALTKVISQGGGDGQTFGLLGFSYISTDNNLEAESAFRMAILMEPNMRNWKMGLLQSMFQQTRYTDAAALCGQLIQQEPERADLWLLQANAYIGLNKPDLAAENYEFVDRLGKSTTASMNMLGDIYINRELYDLAVNAYIRALESDPAAKPDRAIRAAKVLTARAAMDQTKSLIEKLMALRGDQLSTEDHKALLKLQARIAVAEGSGDDEAKVLEKIVELDPLDGEALILLGQHAARNDDLEKAIFYYERAENLEKFEADAKVRHAQLLVKHGKYDEALPLLRRAQQINPRENVQKYVEQVERIAKTR